MQERGPHCHCLGMHVTASPCLSKDPFLTVLGLGRETNWSAGVLLSLLNVLCVLFSLSQFDAFALCRSQDFFPWPCMKQTSFVSISVLFQGSSSPHISMYTLSFSLRVMVAGACTLHCRVPLGSFCSHSRHRVLAPNADASAHIEESCQTRLGSAAYILPRPSAIS